MEMLVVRDFDFNYPEQDKPALQNLNFSVSAGQFVTLCGASGCGKSTLLRQLKPSISAHGTRGGEILFEGRPLRSIDQREESSKIGFVQQSAENQIVTDKVWHELSFGLESLGLDSSSIRGRVAEMASFFGIEDWFYKNVSELSGGQKQLLNLASVMVMQPDLLILDEPTSQLDSIAASDFFSVIGRINRDLGTTVILSEHRLEEAFPMSDLVLVMDKGKLIASGSPEEVGMKLKAESHNMFLSMPSAMRVWSAVESDAPCPVTVCEGRAWLSSFAASHKLKDISTEDKPKASENPALVLKDVWFKYEKDGPDVLRGADLCINRGEIYALLGGNGAGKSTALGVLAGLNKPQRGEVSVNGRIGVLPQNPQSLFVKKTVREDLFEAFKDTDLPGDLQTGRIRRAVSLCRLEDLLDRHPYDLSGGEQQRAALAKVLLLDPDILLLDEATKGLDAGFKREFAGILKALKSQGKTVFMVSHDVEFCAEYCDRCGLFFDGSVVTENSSRAFFSGNNFYTTSVNRMARKILPEAVTAEDLIAACGGEASLAESASESAVLQPIFAENAEMRGIETPSESAEYCSKEEKTGFDDISEDIGIADPDLLPLWRKILAFISGATALFGFIRTLSVTDLSAILGGSEMRTGAQNYSVFYIAGALIVFAFSVNRKSPPGKVAVQYAAEKRKLPKRTAAAAVLIFLMIPLTLFFGEYYLAGRKYYFIAMLILLETMIPFFLVFEGRKPQARELVLIAALCAIGVAGRAAFFMLPGFKPVMAIVIISGVALGGESGFLVGAMTMLASNVMFGQGPWTPWQMFAMGIIGYLAGVLYRKGLLRRSRSSLCVFGALCAIIIYGGIMNPAAALLWSGELKRETLLAYYVTGLPMDLVHAAATALILWFASDSMLEKLDRIKTKYGLVE